MKTSKWLLTTTLAAAIAFSSLSLIASADNVKRPENIERPMQQHMEEMKTAVENGDYRAFAKLAPERLLEVINEDNFSRFQEMHNHRQAAREIAEELGLPQKKMHAKMQKNQQNQPQMGQRKRMGMNR